MPPAGRALSFLAAAALAAAGPAARAADATVKVGACLSLTGPAAVYGAQQKAGLLAAVDELNRCGTVPGVKLEVVIEDDASTKEQGIAVYQRLISRDKVSAIIGPTLSNTATAADPLAQAAASAGGGRLQHRRPRASPTSATTSGASRSPRAR